MIFISNQFRYSVVLYRTELKEPTIAGQLSSVFCSGVHGGGGGVRVSCPVGTPVSPRALYDLAQAPPPAPLRLIRPGPRAAGAWLTGTSVRRLLISVAGLLVYGNKSLHPRARHMYRGSGNRDNRLQFTMRCVSNLTSDQVRMIRMKSATRGTFYSFVGIL